jgi:hypothetical protein
VSESSKYPNIGDYYGYFINKTLEIGNKSVRSNYQISARAHFCKEKQRIAVDSIYSYRVYPSITGFQDITLGFEEGTNGPSCCHHVAISTPCGKRDLKNEFTFDEQNNGGDISKATSVSTEKYKEQSHLDVEIKLTEYGEDHWYLISFKALQPTDGFKFMLHCEEEVVIQNHSIFVVGASYYLDASNSNKDLTITCNQWINEGSGLSVLVAIPHSA